MLSDKAALVTGGTGGIGFAVADALAAQGRAIMLNGLGDAKSTIYLHHAISCCLSLLITCF